MRDPVSSAVLSELVSVATSFLTGKCSEYKSIDTYVDRLEMLHIKIKSAIQVSVGFDINSEPLCEWQEKLKEALSEADETLRNFKARILREKPNRTVKGGSSSRDQSMQEEGSDDATLVHPASNFREAITRQVNLEANLPHDQSMQEERSEDANLVHPASNLRETVTRQVDPEPETSVVTTLTHTLVLLVRRKPFRNLYIPWPDIILCLPAVVRVLNPLTYLENDENVSKLKKTVEKLEKTAGDIGVFIELLKLQSKRKMCRKRKRSARPRRSRGFFLVISLKLQTYALFCYEEDPHHLVVIKLFRANCNMLIGITSVIFIRFVM